MHPPKYRSLLLAIALFAPVLAWSQSDSNFHWSGKLAPENVVEIKNLNGRIEAEPASGDQVEVTAEKFGPDADKVRVVTVPSSSGVTICAIYPGASDSDCQPGPDWHTHEVHGNNTKVNFHVRVPDTVRFSAQSVNGEIRADNLGKNVVAKTVNGSVNVSTKEWADVSSVNGSVEARMGRADWEGTLHIKTVNGSITLEMPNDLSADVNFRSVNGRLNSDFPLTVQGSMGGRHLEGKIGGGGRQLVVETVNGSVDLKKGTI